jgi:hypothetical protein
VYKHVKDNGHSGSTEEMKIPVIAENDEEASVKLRALKREKLAEYEVRLEARKRDTGNPKVDEFPDRPRNFEWHRVVSMK